MVLENSLFPHVKKFFRKLSTVSVRALKTFASTVLGRKGFKNIGLKGRQITNLPWASICIGPALTVIYGFLSGHLIFITLTYSQVSVTLMVMKLLISVSK
jgi:hypothetical protein